MIHFLGKIKNHFLERVLFSMEKYDIWFDKKKSI